MISLKVRTPQDSVSLLGQRCAESLPRKGSLYYLDGNDPDPQYLQCGTISPREVRSVINALRSNYVNIRKRSIFDEIDEEEPEERKRPFSRKPKIPVDD